MPRLIALDESRAAFLVKIEPAASMSMATAKAGGLVLAEDVLATAAIPHQPIALQQGYAVAARATVGASTYMPALLPEAPVLVAAGDALPSGTDSIAEAEDVRAAASGAEILAQVAPGRDVRAAGGDIRAGQIIASAGTQLSPAQIAILRAAGLSEIPVRMPGVNILAPPGTAAAPALIMDLAARASADVHISYVPESRLAGALRSVSGADLILVAGWSGAAFGSVVQALEGAAGDTMQNFAAAPGSTSACGFVATGDKPLPAILLPGRLEETLAGWLLLARPVLDRLAGFGGARPAAALPLARKIASAPGMVDVALLTRHEDKWKPLAVGDMSWGAIAAADAWLPVPAESEGFAAGEIVEAEYL
jgi:molybdopterin molybdotransferase